MVILLFHVDVCKNKINFSQMTIVKLQFDFINLSASVFKSIILLISIYIYCFVPCSVLPTIEIKHKSNFDKKIYFGRNTVILGKYLTIWSLIKN